MPIKREITKEKKAPLARESNPKPRAAKAKTNTWLLDEWKQVKTYLRKGIRPSQKIAIENFEKHLEDVI